MPTLWIKRNTGQDQIIVARMNWETNKWRFVWQLWRNPKNGSKLVLFRDLVKFHGQKCWNNAKESDKELFINEGLQ